MFTKIPISSSSQISIKVEGSILEISENLGVFRKTQTTRNILVFFKKGMVANLSSPHKNHVACSRYLVHHMAVHLHNLSNQLHKTCHNVCRELSSGTIFAIKTRELSQLSKKFRSIGGKSIGPKQHNSLTWRYVLGSYPVNIQNIRGNGFLRFCCLLVEQAGCIYRYAQVLSLSLSLSLIVTHKSNMLC